MLGKTLKSTALAFSLLALPLQAVYASEDDKIVEQQSFDEYAAIEEALQPYITAARTGEGPLTRSAFYDHAHILGSIGGTVYNLDADTFAGAVAEGGPSENVRHHIAWINVSGPAAAARVEFIDWGGNRFTDFFILYKEEGAWKISGKVYDSHTNN
ncbi:nuclear transport factor 2 family protein [uncultured Tateyamaria sp.]|uniref:nuclear transport factor 2 family protein n=1 Tax=uncultured Tateyamaria sp. TaxID=455651 RepID=UPI00261BE616|nr:nuclear transport factor 2 family protein [uncultured Tateyamaria sp.]